jgi:hypothetical protein
MGNVLAWGDQPILDPLDEVANIESITYDRKSQRRSTTLLSMQEATIVVDYNILASKKLNKKSDRDKKKQREELPSSSNPVESDPKLDEVT